MALLEALVSHSLTSRHLVTYTDYLQSASIASVLDRKKLLASIPQPDTPCYEPLVTLADLLSLLPGPWPVVEVQQTYIRLWKLLPETAKDGQASPVAQQILSRCLERSQQVYASLLDLTFSDRSGPAIIDPGTGIHLRHDNLSAYIRRFRLPLKIQHGKAKPIVAISLPNGPLLALAVLGTATYYTAAPIAHGVGVAAEQFKVDVLQSAADLVIASAADVDRLRLHDAWLRDAGIEVLLANLGDGMELMLTNLDGSLYSREDDAPHPNSASDIGIMLFTSGTSGTKKLVPLSIHSIISGVAMVIESWGLDSSMCCLNQMPLNHVGGLIRNLFAPILSGGVVICCSAFDANLFWDCVEDYAPTWYYASPSMHQCILEAAKDRPQSLAQSQIRLVCNAAGGLLPSLACQLRDTFSTSSRRCIVLPSYGMTECMPISTPPLDYQLDRRGTSGISVGPEIIVLDEKDTRVKTGKVGRIGVRGSPVFDGYLTKNDVIDRSCFTASGWFDTGDVGYVDSDGFLYITGRSKEVINRGGELISPLEVEEAVITAASQLRSRTYGRISKALAFSVSHSMLQEVVGIAITVPEGSYRPSLKDIQDSVKDVLNSAKIPVLVVYMGNGLPTNNNKLLRIKLADRLGLSEINDSTLQIDRHYEALCPPPNTPLSTHIGSQPLQLNFETLKSACAQVVPELLEIYLRPDASALYPELILSPRHVHGKAFLDTKRLLRELEALVDGYYMPSKIHQLTEPLPRNTSGEVDIVSLENLLTARDDSYVTDRLSGTAKIVASAIASVLAIPERDIGYDCDFFEAGGNSMAAGQLLSRLRKAYDLRLPIDVLFSNSKVSSLAALIDERRNTLKDAKSPDSAEGNLTDDLLPGCEKTCSSGNPLLMLLQLIPIGLIYPFKRALTLIIFMYVLSFTQAWSISDVIPGRLFGLVFSMGVAGAATKSISPIFGLMFKWVVIGRYREGLYPMWGSYHTRWWMVQKVLAICDIGFFDMFNITRVLYYRLLGASIAWDVSIHSKAVLGEFDLITIAPGAILDRCIVRPFAAERNTSMYLGRICIGSSASVGLAAIVVAGTTVPANACIGPNSSSWEIEDAAEANRELLSNGIPSSHWTLRLLCGLPITMAATFFGAVPWLGCLVALVEQKPETLFGDDLTRVLVWFSSPERVAFHYAALSANSFIGPVFFFLAVWLVKKLFDIVLGRMGPGLAMDRSQLSKFRTDVLRSLMPTGKFHKVADLFGTHYEVTSILARAMGAKVGRRVYWPGNGPTIQDFPLLELGDDVVFGSRSHIVTSDGHGSDYVRVGSGAMVADRVVLLPGVELGQKTVMGSGALTRKGTRYAPNTTWVGAKQGQALCLTASQPDETPMAVGHRSMQYHTTVDVASNFTSMNSSSTTLGKHVGSHRSSIEDVEKGGAVGQHGYTQGRHQRQHGPVVSVHPIADSPKPKEGDHVAQAEASSPFGRAFYMGKAPYRVWGQFTIFCYSVFLTVFTAVFWNAASISAVQVIGRIIRADGLLARHFIAEMWWRPFSIYIFFAALLVAIMAAQSIFALAVVVAAKWILIGRRVPGNYDWDRSSYCQRWQLYLKIEVLRRKCYGGQGILGLLTGTKWIVWYFKCLGMKSGKDCALFAGGFPSLMFTEPDLLTLGDRVSVDDASLVGHINTRGKFDLNPLYVGDRSVLRTGSRLLSGARMEEDACLLEHTLIMAGDVVDAGSTSQGWPAEEFRGSRMPTMRKKQIWVAA